MREKLPHRAIRRQKATSATTLPLFLVFCSVFKCLPSSPPLIQKVASVVIALTSYKATLGRRHVTKYRRDADDTAPSFVKAKHLLT